MTTSDNIFLKESIESIKHEIDTVIFDEKEWINGKMWKLPEVTYSYYEDHENNVNINSTFFCDIGEINVEVLKNTKGAQRNRLILQGKDTFEKKVRKKYALLGEYYEKIERIKPKNIKEEYEKEIISGALKEKRLLLEYALNSIPVELEKAGIKTNYNAEKLRKKQETIDTEVFGGLVRENQKEVQQCYNMLDSFYTTGKHNLSAEEQKRFEGYLKEVEQLLPEKYTSPQKIEKKSLFSSFKNIKIGAKEYIPGFNLILEALNGVRHVVSRNAEVGSISDGPNGVEFPTNDKFASISLARFLKLSDHELDVHSLTDHNNSQIIGKIRGAKCIDKEEGLAKLRELMLEYGEQLFTVDKKTGKTIIDTTKIPMTDEFPNILMGELLSNKELMDFLELKEKISPQKRTPLSNYLRLKRSNHLGVQHKDCSYTRGLFRAVKEINKYILSDGEEGIKYDDLYIGKVGFDEIHKLKKIKEEKEKIENKKLDIKRPLYPADAIMFFLKNRQNRRKGGEKSEITKENLLSHLQKKYPILDFTEEKIIEVSTTTKKSLALAMNFVDNSIKNTTCDDKQKQEKTFLGILHKSLSVLTGERKAEVENI